MSFSVSWPSEGYDVCKPDVKSDLGLDHAYLSPPLDQLTDEVRAAIESVAQAAAGWIDATPDAASGKYQVNANGHVRQPDDSDTNGSRVSINISEASLPTTT